MGWSIGLFVDLPIGPFVDPPIGTLVDPRVGPFVDPSIGPFVDPSIGPFVDPTIGLFVDLRIGLFVDPSVGPIVSLAPDSPLDSLFGLHNFGQRKGRKAIRPIRMRTEGRGPRSIVTRIQKSCVHEAKCGSFPDLLADGLRCSVLTG